METLAFIHAAMAHEDPTPDPEVKVFENIDLKAPSSLAMSLVAAGVVTTTMAHADQARATIYRGDQGPEVATLQAALGVHRDGIFGRQTGRAVRRVQAENGLVVDGIAGPATLTVLGLRSDLSSTGGFTERPFAGGAYVIARSGLIVRDSPAGYEIDRRGYGQRVGLTGAQQYAAGRNWSQLGDGGWVASEYLGYADAPLRPTKFRGGVYVNAGSGLFVRDSPAGNIIDGRDYGSRVGLTGAEQFADGRTWVQIGGGGWVAKGYLSFY